MLFLAFLKGGCRVGLGIKKWKLFLSCARVALVLRYYTLVGSVLALNIDLNVALPEAFGSSGPTVLPQELLHVPRPGTV